MTYDPNAGELLPDGSRIQEATAGEMADYLASLPLSPPCGCADPQPYNLCCPVKLIYPTHAKRRARHDRG